jgi:hypothetical protein
MATLTGFIGGLMKSVLMSEGDAAGTINGIATVALDAASNRVQANLVGTSGARETSFSYKYDSQGGYANYDDFIAFPARAANGEPTSTVNGQSITNQSGAMLGTRVGCDCDYTRWGVWASTGTQGSYTDTVQGLWVAGRPTTIVEMPQTGQATYAGHVIAAIQSEGNVYAAAGSFNNVVNFGNRTGQVTVTGLDSTNYAGQIQFGADPRNFAGSLVGDVGARNMALNGSFFRGVSSPVGEMGGRVAISGTDYLGGGVFVAKMK